MPTEDEWVDADIGADEEAGYHLTRPPEQGVKDMKRRISVLTGRMAALSPEADPDVQERIVTQWKQAHQLLAEYEAMLHGRN